VRMDTLAESMFAEEVARNRHMEDGGGDPQPEPVYIPVPLDTVVREKARAIDVAFLGYEPPPPAARMRPARSGDDECDDGTMRPTAHGRGRYDFSEDEDDNDDGGMYARPPSNKRRKVREAFDDRELTSFDSSSSIGSADGGGNANAACRSCVVCDIREDHKYNKLHEQIDKCNGWVANRRPNCDVGTLSYEVYKYWQVVVRQGRPEIPMISPAEFKHHYDGCDKDDPTIPIDEMLFDLKTVYREVKDMVVVREQGRPGHRVDGTALDSLTKTSTMILRCLEARSRLVRLTNRKT